MSKYQAYPKYEPINAEWLSEIPIGWSTTPLKHVASINMGQSPSSDDCNIDGIGVPFLQGNAEFGVKSPTEKQFCPIPKKVAKAGDLLFSVRAPVGSLNFANKDFGIGRGLCSIRGTNAISQSFLWWVLPSYKYQFDAIATGSTFEAVSAEEVGNLNLALPPILEQTQIANFLDHETAKIDTLIKKQQQLIKLLKEKRQAVISHTVTKGLNPQAPMKYSGVEWLGEVPEHWDVARLKQIIKSGTSISYGIVQPGDALDEGVPFIQTTNISQGNLALNELPKTSKIIEKNYPRSRLSGGEVILGIRASIGAAYVVPKELKGVNLSRGVARIQPSHLISSEFLVRFFQTNAVEQYWGLSKQGSTFSEVSIETVRELYVVIPPKSEQQEICLNIGLVSNRFEHLIKSAEMQRSLLQERRTALISAAVTGKIDVRDWGKDN
ncbi:MULTISPECIES: restriction endonuclease subunit S [Vibrio]|uniref:restriction endonuclease subunit S n=1 Tax=Vibrio TaxID=662 RepID=UPI001A8F21E6|nr:MULTISPECIES: restriction endonuclease subunit S [Vibrio]MBO0211401.1 restriction endonuclease subunit S [Vibrio sp. Vb0877]